MSKKPKRKVCVVLVDRANYGRMKPVMRAIKDHPDLELQTICTGTMLLERFGEAVRIVEKDGFNVDGKIYVELEGSVPTTMAKSVGFAMIEFSTEYHRLQPDIVLLIGDRYEALAAAISAAYMNMTLCHIQGGEVSGSIDESARHAITKFAHYHFPATERAAEYIVRMGENPDHVFNVGCPCGDAILSRVPDVPSGDFKQGSGAVLNPKDPYFLVIFHPVTTEFGLERDQAEELLNALDALKHPTLWLWPNIDAGSDHISKAIRIYRERNRDNGWLHMLKNLPPEHFHAMLYHARCAIGNSSSFIRDSTFMGTPVVLVGDRQVGRETGENLVSVDCRADQIQSAIERQCAHGRYSPSTLYGDGTASRKIAEKLAALAMFRQKRLHYIHDA